MVRFPVNLSLVPHPTLDRLGADKADIAMQQMLNDVEDVKCDVEEVMRNLVEVKCL